MTFELEAERAASGVSRPPGPGSFSREEHGWSTSAMPNTCSALSGPPSARGLRHQRDPQAPGPEGAARLEQDLPPNWLCDAIDVIVFAAVVTVALMAVLGN
jgi:hypothetical protein